MPSPRLLLDFSARRRRHGAVARAARGPVSVIVPHRMRASFATADGAAPAPLRAVSKSVGRRDGAQISWEDDDHDDDRLARTRRQAEARASIALFSVALLWCSSLSAADALVSAFLPPPHLPSSVSSAVSRLVTQARREDADYVACAHRQSDGCVADVLLAAELESRRASAAAARNDLAVAAARRVAARCVAAEARVSSLVRFAQTRRAPLDVPWRDQTCPLASDREATRARVSNPGDALADAADDVSDAAATFRVSSEEALSSATRALRLRAAYDVSYARNKTGILTLAPIRIHSNVTAEVEALAARASAGLAALEAETASALAASASAAGDALASARDDVAAVFEEYVDAVRAYATEATLKLSSAAGWFDAFARVGGWAVDAIAAVAGDVPDVIAPSTPALRLGDVPGVAVAMDVTSRANDVAEGLAARLADVSRAADDAREEMVRAASRVPEAAAAAANLARLPALFDDYDPPPRREGGGSGAEASLEAAAAMEERARVSAATRAAVFANRTAAVARLIESERAAAFTAANRAVDAGSAAADAAASDAADAAARAAAGGKTRLDDAWDGANGGAAWLGVTLPDVDALTDAASFLRAAADALVGADLAYRFARSARAVATHLAPGAPPLPPIDLTVNLQRWSPGTLAFGTGTGKERPPATARVAGALGHPATLAAVRAVAVALAATLVACAYVPLHEAHAAGCARGCDGTFVTRNAHSLAHNYAAARGSRAVAVAAARTEMARRDACAANAPATAARLAQARADLRAARALAVRARYEASRTARCVDVDAYASGPERDDARDALVAVDDPNDDVWSACNDDDDDDDVPVPVPVLSIDGGAAFECGALPACALTCAGPSRRTLAPLARAAGCSAEGLAHDATTRAALTLLVFFAANAARGAAVRGLAAVSWRSLAGNAGFRFEGTLAPDGAPAKPETGGKSLRRVAREKLRRAARAHERRGWLAIAVAVAAQVPGMVTLAWARRSAVAPDAECTVARVAGVET